MRNLITRTVSGLVYIALLISSLFWHPIAYFVLFSFFMIVMMYEYLTITQKEKHPVLWIAAILTGWGVFLLTFLNSYNGLPTEFLLIPVAAIPVLYSAMLYCYPNKEESGYKGHSYLLSMLLYIALPFAMINYLAFSGGPFDGKLVLSLFIMLWSYDVGAYLIGSSLGKVVKKKLFPSISPNKSWAGLFGGYITTILAGYIVYFFELMPYSLIEISTIAFLIATFGTFGDLVESQLKRNFNIKDSGKIMPGHGGLLDRLDGAIIAFPVAIAYILIFVNDFRLLS